MGKLFLSKPMQLYRESVNDDIQPTQREIESANNYFQKMHAERMIEQKPTIRAELKSIDEKLADPELDTSERAKLQIQRTAWQMTLDPPPKSVAVMILTGWKFQKHIYDKYGGGRTLWQQAGIEAFDATRRLIEDLEKQGKFRIDDPQLRKELYKYWTGQDNSPFIRAQDDEQSNGLQSPPWGEQQGASSNAAGHDRGLPPSSHVQNQIAAPRTSFHAPPGSLWASQEGRVDIMKVEDWLSTSLHTGKLHGGGAAAERSALGRMRPVPPSPYSFCDGLRRFRKSDLTRSYWPDKRHRLVHNCAMSSSNAMQPRAEGQINWFTTTRWSIVVAAGGPPSLDAHAAMSTLCETYWYPLYAYSRRRGNTHEDARDLIQSFIASLLENESLRVVDPERGKFRSFLLTALKNFSAKQWRSELTLKRGGASTTLSLDYHEAETRYLCEPEDGRTPETIFERKWAIAILESAMTKLTDEQHAAGKQARFELLKMHLGGDSERVPYRELSSRLGISEGAIKVAVHRLRGRYGQILRDEIAQTVTNPTDLENELRAIFEAVRT